LVNVDSPDYRRGLTLEVLRNLKFGKKNMALEILKEKSTFDETTRRLLNYNPYALEEDEKFSLKVDYPGVGDLDEDRRKILLEKAVEMAYTTGHNDLMVDPLIKILNTHTNPAEELSELATTYLWFITRTKDQCPKALEGLEGESREVKSEYLIVLAKFPAPGAEADFIKKRLKDAETEKRKLEILKEEDQRASKPIDDMLK
jgi:hypothetical protein